MSSIKRPQGPVDVTGLGNEATTTHERKPAASQLPDVEAGIGREIGRDEGIIRKMCEYRNDGKGGKVLLCTTQG
jgi:hypothetical protein